MTGNLVRAAAELEPFGESCGATVDGALWAYPQCLALGTLRRRAERRQIGELPGHEPGIRSLPTVQPPSQPVALEVQNAQSPSKIIQGTSRAISPRPCRNLRARSLLRLHRLQSM